jgi:hypothetical protein
MARIGNCSQPPPLDVEGGLVVLDPLADSYSFQVCCQKVAFPGRTASIVSKRFDFWRFCLASERLGLKPRSASGQRLEEIGDWEIGT